GGDVCVLKGSLIHLLEAAIEDVDRAFAPVCRIEQSVACARAGINGQTGVDRPLGLDSNDGVVRGPIPPVNRAVKRIEEKEGRTRCAGVRYVEVARVGIRVEDCTGGRGVTKRAIVSAGDVDDEAQFGALPVIKRGEARLIVRDPEWAAAAGGEPPRIYEI